MSLRPLIALLFASAGSLFSAPSSHAAPASVPPLRIRSWGTEQGLPHPRITAIAQSNDGLLWLATPRGLVHFDGLTFRTPLGHASLVNRSITALEHSQRHQLWIGTADGSILAIDHSGLHNMGSVSSASIHGSITQLAEDAQGKLWIATSTGQVASLSGSSWLPESIAWTGTKDSRFSLHSTPDHSVVIGSESGLWKPNQQRLLPWGQPSLPPPWRFIAHGSGGQLWLGRAGHDLAIRNHAAASFSLNLPDDNSPISSAVDLDGSLWLTTPTGGLHCFQDNGAHAELLARTKQKAIAFTCLCVDREGTLWAGTDVGGLCKVTHALFRKWDSVQDYQSSTTSPAATPADQRTVVLDYQSEGVATNAGAIPPPPPTPTTRSLSPDIAAIFTTVPRPHIPIHAVFADSDESVWLGRAGEKCLLHYQSGTFSEITIASHPLDVTALAMDTSGILWIGTAAHGVLRLKDGRVDSPTPPAGTPVAPVRMILTTAETTWITTYGAGLWASKNGTLITTARGNGLPDSFLSGIQSDSLGGLWLSGDQGIFRIPLQGTKAWLDGLAPFPHPVTFDASDGLEHLHGDIDAQTGAGASQDGRLWFASNGYIIEGIPSAFRIPSLPPVASMLGCSIDGAPFTPISTIPQGTRRIEFHFTSGSLSHPEGDRFECRLDPFDPQWIPIGSKRSIAYTTLPPGPQRFEVRVIDRYGRTSPLPATTAFTVPAPLWRKGWFLATAAAALALSTWAAVRAAIASRLRPLRQREMIAQALADERRRIARDMHDELGTGLAEIALLTRRIEQSPAASPEAAKAARRSRELVRSIDETVWMLNPRNDNLENLAAYLTSSVTKWLLQSSVRPRFNIDPSFAAIPVSTAARRHLYLACKEITHNTIKHADATELLLEIHASTAEFEISLADNGRGIPLPPPDPARNGLSNLRERLAELQGQLIITTSHSAGTRVTLRVPFTPPATP